MDAGTTHDERGLFLSGREWLAVGALVVLAATVGPALWPRLERLEFAPAYRVRQFSVAAAGPGRSEPSVPR